MASVGDKYKCCDELFAALQDKYREDLVAVPIILFGGTDLLFREQEMASSCTRSRQATTRAQTCAERAHDARVT